MIRDETKTERLLSKIKLFNSIIIDLALDHSDYYTQHADSVSPAGFYLTAVVVHREKGHFVARRALEAEYFLQR